MTATARRIREALVCGDAFTAELGGEGAWADLLVDEVPLTPAFGTEVGSAPNLLEAVVYPDETAAGLAGLVPSAALVEVLDQLTPAMLEVDGQIDALVAVERHIGWLQARSTELLAALDAGDRTKDGFTRDHVAAALRMPPASMRTRMTAAADLVGRLPAALELLRSGDISQRHAIDLADATRSLTPESAAAVEAHVLKRAPEQTVAQFRASVKRAVLRVSGPKEEEKSHADAVGERRVILYPDERGMANVNAYLSAEDAATVMAALDAVAQETIHGKGGDTRTADQRRADALVALCSHALGDPHLIRSHGHRADVHVTIAASTLAGHDEQPADLEGYGPVTAAAGRDLAFDEGATWRIVITDDDGLIQHVGSRTYRPPAGMARTVIARDVHCVFPGCRKKARHNDLDHVDAYKPGDETTTANLMSLCRRHHRLKHSGDWTAVRDDRTGVTTWTHRTGRQYRSRPPTRPTTTTTAFDQRPTEIATTAMPPTEATPTPAPDGSDAPF